MPTTTQITNIADKLDLTAYAGDFIDDYDMAAVHADYVDRLSDDLPVGIDLLRNGDVIATLAKADEARDFDWDEFIGAHDPADIFERHDRTAWLLPAVAMATKEIERLERKRVDAIRAAKDSGRFTVEEIARAAKITRDGVYKLLARVDLPFNTEPPVGTVIRVESGRTFRRTDHHIDFHWMDEHGWYRWSEVRGHANRENGQIIDQDADLHGPRPTSD